jgi:putative colanic acid biosysnthesis UDP-glucose lipid carrier transferase
MIHALLELANLSAVGPRPHAVDHNESYRKLIPGYMQRHACKPGLTGLAQVEGFRGETKILESMANRVEADLRYQKEMSLELDIAIIIRTFLSLWTDKAY